MLKLVTYGFAMVGLALVPKTVFAAPVRSAVSIGYGVISSEKSSTLPVQITLNGVKPESLRGRPHTNVALVLDRSGSMAGEKLDRAKDAAIAALWLLSSDDIVSIVTYDDRADVVVPATKLTDRNDMMQKIRAISSGGNTALFAGVSRGAAELAKFRDVNRVNRIILLSDGLANVGPSTTGALGDLGVSLQKDGISVTTIGLGLGYNEDLMATLARKSDGNHVFAENATDLASLFKKELGDVLSVVAQNVLVTVQFPEGVRPVRSLGRDAEIFGQKIVARLNQVYSDQQRYILVEAEVTPRKNGEQLSFAQVEVSYFDPIEKRQVTDQLSGTVGFSASSADIEASIQRETMAAYYSQLSTLDNQRAIALADQGKKSEAQAVLRSNAKRMGSRGKELKSDSLLGLANEMEGQADAIASAPYEKARKQITYEQNKVQQQQQ